MGRVQDLRLRSRPCHEVPRGQVVLHRRRAQVRQTLMVKLKSFERCEGSNTGGLLRSERKQGFSADSLSAGANESRLELVKPRLSIICTANRPLWERNHRTSAPPIRQKSKVKDPRGQVVLHRRRAQVQPCSWKNLSKLECRFRSIWDFRGTNFKTRSCKTIVKVFSFEFVPRKY